MAIEKGTMAYAITIRLRHGEYLKVVVLASIGSQKKPWFINL